MFRDPDDRYGLRTYRKVTLTLALALVVVVGVRVAQRLHDAIELYIGAALLLLALGIFTEPVYHLFVGRRQRR